MAEAQVPTSVPTAAPTPAVPGQKATDGNVTNEPKVEPKFWDVKVNGQNRRWSEDELKSKAILGEAAHEKFAKAAQTEKKYSEWKERAQKDAISALMDPELGLTKEQIKTKFESWYKENFIDPETMTKEQKAEAEWKKRAESAENELKSEREVKAKAEQEKQMGVLREQVQNEMIQICEKSDLPKTRFTVGRLAFYQRQNISQGFEAPPEMLIQQVKDERNSIIKSLVDASTPEQLVEMLGDDLIKKLRKYDLGRINAKLNPGTQAPEGVDAVKRGKGNIPMAKVDNYFNELRRSKR